MTETQTPIEAAKSRALELDLVDPTGVRSTVDQTMAAPRLATLTGRTAGILDNRKGNADRLLAHVGALLQDRYEVKDLYQVKKFIYSRRAEPAIIEDLAANCDFVVTAIGD